MVISRSDRVSAVIGSDESLIDVFVALSPAFERLRSPALRKVMTRLVTVEQAARVAGVDVDELVARLNAHGADTTPDPPAPGARSGSDAVTSASAAANASLHRPEALSAVPADKVVELDVRAELRAGREPFSLIMAALRTVPEGGVFCVRAIFEPVPLYAVMKKQGFDHWTERLADDDWRVWFHPPADSARDADSVDLPDATDFAEPTERGADVVIVDVRGLEPPEPLMRTMAALEQLPRGATLLQINVRTPEFLLPMLAERGFTYHVREQEPDLVRVFIRHTS